MQFMTCDVNTYCIGQAASMGAVLLAAGTKGKRYALPNADIMIHQCWAALKARPADIRFGSRTCLRLKDRLNECSRSIAVAPPRNSSMIRIATASCPPKKRNIRPGGSGRSISKRNPRFGGKIVSECVKIANRRSKIKWPVQTNSPCAVSAANPTRKCAS